MNTLDITLITITVALNALLLYTAKRIEHLEQENEELKQTNRKPTSTTERRRDTQ